jgi:hypothetical protein
MALSKIDVANMLTGTTPVANGGTGVTTAAALANTGNLVLLNSASSTVDIAQLDIDSTYINSTYDNYLMTLNILPATDAVILKSRFFVGGSIHSSGYGRAVLRTDGGSYTVSANNADSQGEFQTNNLQGNGSGETQEIRLNIDNVNSTSFSTTVTHFSQLSADTGSHLSMFGQYRLNDISLVPNGIRFYYSSGNISEYQYKLYGIK